MPRSRRLTALVREVRLRGGVFSSRLALKGDDQISVVAVAHVAPDTLLVRVPKAMRLTPLPDDGSVVTSLAKQLLRLRAGAYSSSLPWAEAARRGAVAMDDAAVRDSFEALDDDFTLDEWRAALVLTQTRLHVFDDGVKGLCPVVDLFNHASPANVVCRLVGDDVACFATRPISAGEQAVVEYRAADGSPASRDILASTWGILAADW